MFSANIPEDSKQYKIRFGVGFFWLCADLQLVILKRKGRNIIV